MLLEVAELAVDVATRRGLQRVVDPDLVFA